VICNDLSDGCKEIIKIAGNWLRSRRVGKIAALLQAFGLSVGSCGLANVLQCAVAVARSVP